MPQQQLRMRAPHAGRMGPPHHCTEKTLSHRQVPFTLGSCAVPGLGRWVTTSIYRFDASMDWPTDLDCLFKWNTGLKTFDGACAAAGCCCCW